MGCSSAPEINQNETYNKCFTSIRNLSNEIIRIFPIKENEVIVVTILNFKILDLSEQKEILTCKHEEEIYSVNFLPSPNRLFLGTCSGTLIIENLFEKTTLKLNAHLTTITYLYFLENGNLLSCDGEGVVYIWDLEEQVSIFNLSIPDSKPIWCACELKNNNKIVLLCGNNKAYVINLHLKSKDKISFIFNAIDSKYIIQLKDERLIFNSGNNLICYEEIKIPSIHEDFKELRKKGLNEPDFFVENAHNSLITYILQLKSRELLTGASNGSIHIWRIEQKKLLFIINLEGHHDNINYCIELPNGKLATGGDDKMIKLWTI
jgi:WD40 repeat protein